MPRIKLIVRIGILTLALLSVGCALNESTIIPLSDGKNTPDRPPKPPESVGVYRVANPFASFTELGIITFRTELLSYPQIYDRLRVESAAQGADAVVGVKITSETHQESYQVQNCTPETSCSPQTSCDALGNCSTTNVCDTHQKCEWQTEWKDVTTYLVEGTMIGRKL